MQLLQLPISARLSVLLVLCTTCLAFSVSAAPMLSGALFANKAVASAEAAKQPVLNVISEGSRWIVDPHDVPPLTRSSSFKDVLRKKLNLDPIKVTATPEGVHIRNSGSSPRLARFGAKDRTYIVMPGTTETVPWTRQSLHELTIDRVSPRQEIRYHE